MKCSLYIYKNNEFVNYKRTSNEEALLNMCIAFSHRDGRNGVKKAYFKPLDRTGDYPSIEAIIEFKPLNDGSIYKYEYFFAGHELNNLNLGM